jgi:hypothetical protein
LASASVPATARSRLTHNTWTENTHAGSSFSSVLAEAMYYPLAAKPIHVAGGLGWGSGLIVERVADADGDPLVAAAGGNGLSWMAGAGYDLTTGDGLNLGLQLRYDGLKLSDLGAAHSVSLSLMLNFY